MERKNAEREKNYKNLSKFSEHISGKKGLISPLERSVECFTKLQLRSQKSVSLDHFRLDVPTAHFSSSSIVSERSIAGSNNRCVSES